MLMLCAEWWAYELLIFFSGWIGTIRYGKLLKEAKEGVRMGNGRGFGDAGLEDIFF
jgi:hypothetical protein